MTKYLFTVLLLITAMVYSQTVVVNKYYNSGQANGAGDAVELLVVQNNLDMRGMIVKDFSSSMANDGGGKYEFTQNSLWQNVKSGTLIILRTDNTAADIDPADFVLDVGLKNTTYFTSRSSGTFDIATTDMVMIKAAGSDTAGVVGSIHVLAGGTAGTQFTAAPEPKLRSTTTSGSNKFIIAKNSTSTIADYNGTDATTDSLTIIFGQGNTASNTVFINQLRGGVALNTTVQFASAGLSVPSTGGTAKVYVSITNPSSTNATTVTAALTGGTGTNGVEIQTFSPQNLTFPAASSANQSFDVIVKNTNLTSDKTFIFTLQNPAGGTNASVGSQATFTLTITGTPQDTTTPVPISRLRYNNSDGVPVDSGKYFTVQGVITVGNELNSPSYMQDGTAGVAVYGRGSGQFSSKVSIGDSIKVRGRLTHFRGLTQMDSATLITTFASNKPITPKVLTIPEITGQTWNSFEAYEGMLIEVKNVKCDSTGLWLGNTNYIIYNGANTIAFRPTSGISLVGQPIPTGEFNVIGALGQFKSAAPYSDGYQILPRNMNDVVPVTSVNEGSLIPDKMKLSNNYPNPFNPSTVINYSISVPSQVTLKVYDIIGNEVATLVNGKKEAGNYKAEWNASGMATGIYFYRLNAGAYTETKKMTLIK